MKHSLRRPTQQAARSSLPSLKAEGALPLCFD
jgi:hypothetical protein